MREVLDVEDGWSGTDEKPGRRRLRVSQELCHCVTYYKLQTIPGEE